MSLPTPVAKINYRLAWMKLAAEVLAQLGKQPPTAEGTGGELALRAVYKRMEEIEFWTEPRTMASDKDAHWIVVQATGLKSNLSWDLLRRLDEHSTKVSQGL